LLQSEVNGKRPLELGQKNGINVPKEGPSLESKTWFKKIAKVLRIRNF